MEAAREQQKEEKKEENIGLDNEEEYPALGAITAKNPLEEEDDEEYEDIEEGDEVEEIEIDGDDEQALATFSKGGEVESTFD